jgi:hypothetical protein
MFVYLSLVTVALVTYFFMPLDLEEIRPNRFLIHNAKSKMYLRGEGVTVGNTFELTSWRRDGLIARLRQGGFTVRTIDERIAALPPLPLPVPFGDMGVRELQHPKERYAYFDTEHLRWIDVQPTGGTRDVQLRVGWVLRRRRGRGAADHYLATLEKPGRIGLLPRTETAALLMGYAQATADGERTVHVTKDETIYRLLDHLLLPSPHSDALKTITERRQGMIVIFEAGWTQAQQLFATLALRLEA